MSLREGRSMKATAMGGGFMKEVPLEHIGMAVCECRGGREAG